MSSMSLSGTAPGPLPPLDNTFGAWLLGSFIVLLMQGIAYNQTYTYFRRYPKDPSYLKVWVVTVLVMETFNTILAMHSCYAYLITNYSNPTVLVGRPIWSMPALPIPGSIAAVVSQTFFLRRVYIMGGRRFMPVVIVSFLLYLAFVGFYIALSIKTFSGHSVQELSKYSWLASVGSSLMMAGDFLVTAVLIYTLRQSRTGITRTDSLLDLLILYSITTGLLICVFNVLNVAFAIALPGNLIYPAAGIILTKLYANTFLVALNTRQTLINRGMIGENETSPFKTTLLRGPQGVLSQGVVPERVLNISQTSYTDVSSHPATVELKMENLSRDSGDIHLDEFKGRPANTATFATV